MLEKISLEIPCKVSQFKVSTATDMLSKVSQFKVGTTTRISSFIKNNFRIKNDFYYSGVHIPEKYDVIICGSDQIWRYNFRGNMGFEEVYFAKYPVNKKTVKLSYAASMGDKDFDENALKIFSKLIKNFDFISVREDAMQALIEPNASPVKVVDPVSCFQKMNGEKWFKGM